MQNRLEMGQVKDEVPSLRESSPWGASLSNRNSP